LCLDPAMQDLECGQGCGTPAWQGDGHCDDSNNLCGCDWDRCLSQNKLLH
jgi:hypothetical protein